MMCRDAIDAGGEGTASAAVDDAGAGGGRSASRLPQHSQPHSNAQSSYHWTP